MLYRYVCYICFILAVNSRCSQPGDKTYAGDNTKSPDGYNLTKPVLIKLPVELDEISGVAFYPKDTSIFAIGDEFGWLYKIPLTPRKPIRKWKFSNEGDYEDMALVDKVFYVLQSSGNIVAFTFNDHNQVLQQ